MSEYFQFWDNGHDGNKQAIPSLMNESGVGGIRSGIHHSA